MPGTGPGETRGHTRGALYLGTSRLGTDLAAGGGAMPLAHNDGGAPPDAPSGGAALADALLSSGFDGVDTSNNYTGGYSERLLGAAIRRAGGVPAGVVLITKADAHPVTGVFDGDRVMRSFEESLDRLGVDRLPVFHLHDPYTITVSEAMAPGGAVSALVNLREQGLVGSIGVAAGPLPMLMEYLDTGAFDAVLSHNRFTLADRGAAELFAAAKASGITVFNAAPFGGGILAGSASASKQYAYRPASAGLLGWIERLKAICADWDTPPASAALDFSLHHPDVDASVVGITSLQRLSQLRELLARPVPEGLRTAIAGLGTPPPGQAT